MKNKSLGALFLITAVVGMVALFGGYFTGPNVSPMYQEIQKPSWAPPGWLFGPVWTLLYILIAFAGWRVWLAKSSQSIRMPMVLYILQLVLNGLWTLIYFELQMPWLAFCEITALFFLILACMKTFWSLSRSASLSMAPYALWVGFAMILNFSIARMNP
ncbi:MAG: tryptophan-rich sensory protein [Desulfatibacillum sp.]|nr:tryptophan-rich sensory protein [Desulfatibacillum sp.]